MLPYNNILVIQTAFIGDAILASSVLEKLHVQYPAAQISILVRSGNEGIYQSHPFLKEVLIWDKAKSKTRHLISLLFEIRRNKYDCIVNCHRYASSGFLTGFSGARHTAGFKQNPFSFLFAFTARHVIGDGRHEIERYNELTSDFAGKTLFMPRLYPSREDFNKTSELATGSFVCFAPASVWFTKQLPEEKWAELADLIAPETRIVMIGAPGDQDLCDRIASRCKRDDLIMYAGRLSLLESAALMSRAQMNYVNDSAPLHLASALNAPVTAFFCSTTPVFGFGPLSETSKVCGIQLPCRPCGIRGYKKCPLGHFMCGHEMKLSEAISADRKV